MRSNISSRRRTLYYQDRSDVRFVEKLLSTLFLLLQKQWSRKLEVVFLAHFLLHHTLSVTNRASRAECEASNSINSRRIQQSSVLYQQYLSLKFRSLFFPSMIKSSIFVPSQTKQVFMCVLNHLTLKNKPLFDQAISMIQNWRNWRHLVNPDQLKSHSTLG